MAFEIPNFYIGVLPAAADLSAGQFKVVGIVDNGSGQAAVNYPSAGGQGIGVLQNKPLSGEAATVMNEGITKALLGTGGITVGQNLMAGTSGVLVLATSGNYIVAQALETGVSGDVISVLLKPMAAKV